MREERGLLRFWSFLPKPVKQWLKAASIVLALILLVGLWNKLYGIGLFFSFVHADWAIAYWLRIGTGTWSSIAVAAICGNFGPFGLCALDYWWVDRGIDTAKWLSRFWKRLRTIYKALIWAASFPVAGWIFTKVGWKWSAIIVGICLFVIIFEKIWPRKPKVASTEKKSYPAWLLKMRYAALPLFPIDPYLGTTLGIAFYRALKLNRPLSLVMLGIGNTIKMALIGFGWNAVNTSTSSWSANSYIAFVATIIVASIIIFRLIRR